jgi:hypothetical protein
MRPAKTERHKILEWRAERLRRCGLPDMVAAALAVTDNDLHVMERALQAGMTTDQAERVFL